MSGPVRDGGFRVAVDEHRCIGAGQCVLGAPRIFDQREDGIVVLLDASPPVELHDAARRAADLCPAGAILIEERPGTDLPARAGVPHAGE